VLTLSGGVLFSEQTGHDAIPFTEQVTLGGETWMPGYFPGRLIDRSAAVAKLDYSFPLAAWVDATFQASVGNVFDGHLDNFQPNLLRVSGAVGLTTTSDPPLELVVGFGTETFEQGATVDSFRISFGIPRRF